MKTINDIEVEVTFRVKLSDVKVPDNVYKGFIELENEYFGEIASSDVIKDKNIMAAYDWLGENIKYEDGLDYIYQIEIT